MSRRAMKSITRLGEGDLILDNRRVGSIWVRTAEAEHACDPRLLLKMGCELNEVTTSATIPPSRPLLKFRIATLGGQLRWSNAGGPIIGDLSFPRGLEHIQARSHMSEGAFSMCCSVPFSTLKWIEDKRCGEPLELWMDLAGSWAIDGAVEPIFQHPWPIRVPQETWGAFLESVDYAGHAIQDWSRGIKNRKKFQAAIKNLTAAHGLIQADPNAAVGRCRFVFEALDSALKGYAPASEFLKARTDARRGK